MNRLSVEKRARLVEVLMEIVGVNATSRLTGVGNQEISGKSEIRDSQPIFERQEIVDYPSLPYPLSAYLLLRCIPKT
jgi:hypothetical protein